MSHSHAPLPSQIYLFDTIPGIDPGPLPTPIPGMDPDYEPDPEPDPDYDPEIDPDPSLPPGPGSSDAAPGFPGSIFPEPAPVT